MPFSSSKHLFSDALQRRGISEQVNIALVLEYAGETIQHTLGEHIARHIRPISIRYKTLGISVAHTGAAAHLGMHHEEILARVNEKFPGTIERIRLLSGSNNSSEYYE